ncbi:MAG: hypothetical protein U9N61_08885, partial [Euryarchaeota archaeon]|nr:hypothetical protein [Euryarchaeota archaeon]
RRKEVTKKLKLYVWEDVLYDYTPGIVFALAASVEQAREIIIQGEYTSTPVKASDISSKPQVFESPVGFAIMGGG